MSLILIYLEIPSVPAELHKPAALAMFDVEAKLARQPASLRAKAITDGVASDLFCAFGNDTRGRAGSKLRTALLAFIRSRQRIGGDIYLKLLAAKGPVARVVFDVKVASHSKLTRLRLRLKTLQPGEVIKVEG